MQGKFHLLLCLLLTGTLAACATINAGHVADMSIPPGEGFRYGGKTPLREAVMVGTVTGTQEVMSMPMNLTGIWIRQGKLDELREAITSSLRTAKLLDTQQTNAAPYVLHAQIQRAEWDRAIMSNATLMVDIEYRLVRSRDGAEVFRAIAKTSDGVTPMDKYGLNRVHGALRRNIFQLVERLYEVDIR